jgi:hypothetical protein
MSRQPGQSRGILNDEGEGRQVAPWPVQAEPRHPQHDEIAPFAAQRLEAQTELVQHARRVVLDHDVTRRDQPAHQSDAPLVAQVDRHALLVRVERGKDRATFPVVVL